ncbi:MAG: hypothetical protein ACREOR_07575 [Candidatus Binatia bacterium]
MIQPLRVVDVLGWRTGITSRTVHGTAQGVTMVADKGLLLAEEKTLRRLGRAMDVAAALLWKVNLTLEEAQDVVNHAKHTALQLFPDKEETFDLIYGARFRRILTEKYRLQ